MKTVEIYTDGACSGNPGPGGLGVVMKYAGVRKELSEGYKLTTNNRMEIMAVIVGLTTLKERCAVHVYSDSKYVVDAINLGWAKKWRQNNWMRNKKDKASNVDLWEQILALNEKHDIKFIWVKGHANNAENNRCDELATGAILSQLLKDDVVYTDSK